MKARTRLHLGLVCAMSSIDDRDYHDIHDDALGSHMCHMVTLECVRCGKKFTA